MSTLWAWTKAVFKFIGGLIGLVLFIALGAWIILMALIVFLLFFVLFFLLIGAVI